MMLKVIHSSRYRSGNITHGREKSHFSCFAPRRDGAGVMEVDDPDLHFVIAPVNRQRKVKVNIELELMLGGFCIQDRNFD